MKNRIKEFYKLKFGDKKSEERGIALIMTLGILSMLLVLALAFASTARTDRKAAAANANIVQARLLAESAIQRLAALSEHYNEIASHCDSDTHDSTALPNISKPWFLQNEDTTDWIHHLSESDYFDTELLAWKAPLIDLTSSIKYGELNWEYVFVPVDANYDGSFDDTAGTGDYLGVKDYNKIIGRMAYVLIPETGIDPAALVASGVNESGYLEERVGISVSEINIASLHDSNNVKHSYDGTDGDNLDFDAWLAGSINPPGIVASVEAFGWASNASGTFDDATWYGPKPQVNGINTGTGWPDFQTMFDNSHINITNVSFPSTYLEKQEVIKKWFVENPVPSKEAFWVDNVTANGEIDAGELYHRFNLGYRYIDYNDNASIDIGEPSWNDLDGDGTTFNNDNDVGVLLGTVGPKCITAPGTTTLGLWNWTNTGAEDGETSATITNPNYRTCSGAVIPWLANWKDDGVTNGTFGAGAAGALLRSKQIAANLIDYCDDDDDDGNPATDTPIPTSNVDPTSWDATAANTPTYTGNEKTPYINEIGVTVKCVFDVSDPNSPPDGSSYLRSAVLEFEMVIEVINIYNEPLPGATIVTILDGNFDGTYKYGTVGYNNNSSEVPDEDFIGKTFAIPPMAANSYETFLISWTGEPYDLPAAANIDSVGLKELKVTINKVLLNYDGKNVDYVNINTTITEDDLGGQIGVGNSGMKYAFFSFQAKDPRQNLNSGDWNTNSDLNPGYTEYGGGTAEFGTIVPGIPIVGIVNFEANPKIDGGNAGFDLEEVTDPKNGISTAFIANEPMISPWELGAIHRGKAWETINLKKYNTTQGSTGGGKAYADGDANILDQIKMTNNTESPMKINYTAAASSDILYALLNKIRIGATWADIGTTGTAITGTPVSNVVTAMQNETSSMTTRASVANATALFNDTCGETQDTDALQEELIGKFINLTTANTTTSTSSSDFFNALIITQTIKDIGGTDLDIPIYKNLDGDEGIDGIGGHPDSVDEVWDIDGKNSNSSTSGISPRGKYLNFDDFKNDTLPANSETIQAQMGRYDQYADEILSEQKMKVQLYRDPITKKITIKSIEYLND